METVVSRQLLIHVVGYGDCSLFLIVSDWTQQRLQSLLD